MMRAKMKTNLYAIYKSLLPDEVDADIYRFLNSIDGKEVTLIFTHGDAFEINDNNIWLPNELWDEIK